MTLSLIFSAHKSNIIFSTMLKPLSKYIEPIRASQLSAITLSSIIFIFFFNSKVNIYFSRLIFFAICKHVFLFTSEANFLSKIPSFSSG